jgi:hypothetical protein
MEKSRGFLTTGTAHLVREIVKYRAKETGKAGNRSLNFHEYPEIIRIGSNKCSL